MADITISSTRKPITVDLVGVEYRVVPPKAVLAIEMSNKMKRADISATMEENPETAIDLVFEWLDYCMFKKDITAIRKRLHDNDDDLDLPHLTELLTQVTEMSSGNPSTSPSDSSDS